MTAGVMLAIAGLGLLGIAWYWVAAGRPHEPLVGVDKHLPIQGRWLGYVLAVVAGLPGLFLLILVLLLIQSLLGQLIDRHTVWQALATPEAIRAELTHHLDV